MQGPFVTGYYKQPELTNEGRRLATHRDQGHLDQMATYLSR